MQSLSALKGLIKKSKAPRRMASTATCTDPWAVMTMTAEGIFCSEMPRRISSPSMSGSTRSNSTALGGRGSSAASAAAPVSTWMTSKDSSFR